MERCRFIAEHRTRWSVVEMCRVLEVSRSWFDNWCRQPESTRTMQTRCLDADIQRLFVAHQGRAGSPKITRMLRQEAWTCIRISWWVGQLSPSLSHHAVLKALRRALRWRQPAHGLIFHSDRGVQYACTGFQKELKAQGLVCSMSWKADPWAHAVAESFFSILKSELVYDTIWEGYFDASGPV